MSRGMTHPGILVGVDGSSSSRVAVQWAAQEAMMRNVALTLVHVVSTPATSSAAVAWPAPSVLAELRQWQEDEARKVIADAIKVVEDSTAGTDRPEINGELFFSAPAPTLIDLSKEAPMIKTRRGPAGFAPTCSWVSSPAASSLWWCPSPSTPS